MRVNFSGLANATTSTQLPPGNYEFEITGVDPEYTSKDKGTPALEVKARVVEGMDFDDGSSTRGLVRTLRFWYPNGNQKDGGKFCLGRLNDFVKACGLSTTGDGFNTDDLVGQHFICRCKIVAGEKGDNEEYDKFKAVR